MNPIFHYAVNDAENALHNGAHACTLGDFCRLENVTGRVSYAEQVLRVLGERHNRPDWSALSKRCMDLSAEMDAHHVLRRRPGDPEVEAAWSALRERLLVLVTDVAAARPVVDETKLPHIGGVNVITGR